LFSMTAMNWSTNRIWCSSRLFKAKLRKTKAELYQLQHPYSDLTPLGQKLLADVEGVNATQDREQIFKLKTTLEELYLRMSEVQSRIAMPRSWCFSGEVFVRKSAVGSLQSAPIRGQAGKTNDKNDS
jgi:hypothetical protein